MQIDNPTLRVAWNVTKEHPWRIALLFLFIILVIAGALLPPQVLRLIIDTKLVPKTTEGLLSLTLLYLGLLLATNLFDFLKSALLTDYGQRLVSALREAMAEKMRRLPLAYYTSHTPGSITSHYSSDAEQVNSLFSSGLINLLIDLSKIIGIFLSIALFSRLMALVTLLFMAIMFLVTMHFRGALFRVQKVNLAQLGKVNSLISETLANIHTVKAFARESYMEDLYSKRLRDNYETLEQVNFYDSLFPTFVQVLKHGLIAVVILLTCSRSRLLGITLGTLAASIDLVSHLFQPIDLLGQELEKIQEGKSGLARINEFLSEPQEAPKDEHLALRDITPDGSATITFDHLSFHYPDSQELVLKDIDLAIPDKGNLAFIGRTGVGKTTLFRLVLGLMPPSAGKVTYNGVDVFTIPNRLKRHLFGYVEQEFVPVEGDLFEQVRLYDRSISDSDVLEALDFVGLSSLVGKPFHVSGLSQGQKQLFSIARAIVANPPVLLFDEITASLDARTEEHLVHVLFKAASGRTVLAISHRESTMRSARNLVLIQEGRIAGQGTPEKLLARLKGLEAEEGAPEDCR